MLRRQRVIEWGKNLLIVLLVCSAIYLFLRVQGGMLSAGWLSEFLPGTETEGTEGAALSDSAVRPVRIVLKGEGQDTRFGVQYSGETDAVFESAGGLLAEALSTAEAPYVVTEAVFRAALNGSSAYFDFLGPLPLSDLCLWLAHTENAALPDHLVRRLAVAQRVGSAVALYYINESDGLYYACNLDDDLAALLAAVAAAHAPNLARFAYESGAAYESVTPFVLILPDPPALMAYTARSPLGTVSADSLSAPLEQLLLALDFHPQLGGVYPSADGLAVRDGAEVLRVSSSGVVSYHAPDGADEARYPAADPVHAARAIAEATAGALCGSARLGISDIRTDGGTTVVTFSYRLDGAEVVLPGGAPAVEVVVADGAVTEFTLRLRTYEPTGEACLILPELQAAAALSALSAADGELLLRYSDTGAGAVAPEWGV